MKEITRIHIAKVAYDIELDAKKDIEKYMTALERYANDPDILGDIEIRITELLAERGVRDGGVIAVSDVEAVRAQLGEPSDFAAEGADEAVASKSDGEQSRRVYRNTDDAIVGGVLSGFAQFFGIDSLWVRLVFIVLLFASFGTAIIIYLILWLIIPPAETAAEKLRMSGRAVTLASIKDLVKREERGGEKSLVVQRFLGGATGTLLILMAIAGLMAIVAVVAGVQFGFGADYSPAAEWGTGGSWWFMAMMALFIVSGLLFSALCFLLASAVFSRKWTRQIGTAVVVIIASGLIVFASGVAMGMYGYFEDQARLSDMRETSHVNLPGNFSAVKTLNVISDETTGGVGYIQYIVSDKLRYEIESLPGVKPQFEIADDSLSATVKLVTSTDEEWRPWSYAARPVLKIYGPALDAIVVDNDGQDVRYYSAQAQKNIAITVRGGSGFELAGNYEKVNIVNEAGARTILDNATITELRVDSQGGTVTAGVVRKFAVNQADVCAANERGVYDNFVRVQAVSGGMLVYNDKEMPAKTIAGNCGKVIVGLEHSEEEL